MRVGIALASAGAAVLVAIAAWPARRAPELRYVERTDAELLEIERLARGQGVAAPASDGALAPLPRRALGPHLARLLLPIGDGERGNVYDAQAFFRYREHLEIRTQFPQHPAGGWWLRTNSLGLKGSREVSAERPALRILVTGDSHTDGFCADEETFARRLETLLAPHVGGTVEALNGGHAGYTFYQYLGVLERYLHLAPDVFVVAVYTGNDFVESLIWRRTFAGELDNASLKEPARIRAMATDVPAGVFGQGLRQVIHFRENPSDEELALDTAVRATLEMARTCRANGIAFVPFVLPPFSEVEPEQRLGTLALARQRLALTPREIDTSARLTDEWIARLARNGVDVLDPRARLRGADEALYWDEDCHLSVAGHARVAEWLAEELRLRVLGSPSR